MSSTQWLVFSQVVVGFLGLSGVIFGATTQRRTAKDQYHSTESAATATAKVSETTAVIDAWKAFVVTQDEQIRHLTKRLKSMEEERDASEIEKLALRRELSRLQLDIATNISHIAETGVGRDVPPQG